jgi:hypothetical protein
VPELAQRICWRSQQKHLTEKNTPSHENKAHPLHLEKKQNGRQRTNKNGYLSSKYVRGGLEGDTIESPEKRDVDMTEVRLVLDMAPCERTRR